MLGKIYTSKELTTGNYTEIEPAVFPGWMGGSILNTSNGMLSAISVQNSVTESVLNGVIAKAIHNLLVDTTKTIDIMRVPNCDYLAVRFRIGGTTSYIRAFDTGGTKALAVSGPAVSRGVFIAMVAQAVITFMLANTQKFPGVLAEYPGLVSTYTDKAASLNEKTAALSRFADAVNYYLTQIIAGAHELTCFADETSAPELENVVVVEDDKLIQKSFYSPTDATTLVSKDFGVDTTATNVTINGKPSRYVGPLLGRVTRYITRVKHTLISGPTSTGKTLCVEEACENLGTPLTLMKGAEYLEDIDMIGGFLPGNNGLQMIYGPLTRALKLGQEQYQLQLLENAQADLEVRAPVKLPPSVLFIDEINRLQGRFLNLLISAMNVTKTTKEYCVEIPCNGEIVTCPEDYFVIIGAQNLGILHSNTYATDLALDRRFYGKLDVDYLSQELELNLLQSRVPDLSFDVAQVLCKVAADSRYQLECLRAPVDTDTLLKWGEEISDRIVMGANLDLNLIIAAAQDIVFGICIERDSRAKFDADASTIFIDNIKEAWQNNFVTKKKGKI